MSLVYIQWSLAVAMRQAHAIAFCFSCSVIVFDGVYASAERLPVVCKRLRYKTYIYDNATQK